MLIDWDAYLIFKTAGILTFIFAGSFFAHRKLRISFLKSLFITTCAVGLGFVFSRFWYIVQHAFGSESYDPATFREAWDDAGSVLYGWIFGGAVAVVLLTQGLKIHTIKFLDTVLPWMLVAQMLNRFGCFAGQCCWGKRTHFFISVWNFHEKALVHPAQLYEAAFDAALFILIGSRARKTGQATYWYFFGYSFGRFFLEFLRGDNHPALLFLTVPQWAALFIMAGIYFLWKTPELKKSLADDRL